MNKRGRKKLPEWEKRKHPISCRLTDAEFEVLKAGKPSAITLGEWMRSRALSRRLPKPIPKSNREHWGELGKALGNLNQIAKHLNQGYGEVSSIEILLKSLQQEIVKLRLSLLGKN